MILNTYLKFKSSYSAKNTVIEQSKEIGELKAFAVTKEMACKFRKLLRGKISKFTRYIDNIFKLIYMFSCKTRSKKKKTSGDILNSIRI